jgi:hypothetical protein
MLRRALAHLLPWSAPLWIAFAPGASATTLTVASNGADGGTCGAAATPCRSISQAIANAAPGDTISVLPGRYGDLDADGVAGEPGEEGAQFATCDCFVLVDKTLTILSRDGAAVTELDGGGSTTLDLVRIAASGVAFGKKNKGFTLTRGRGAVWVRTGFAGVAVAGNVAVANGGTAFLVDGSGNLLEDNRAEANGGIGFTLRDAGGHTLRRSLAVAHTNPISGAGIYAQAGGNTLVGNVSTGNVNGLALGGVDNAISQSSFVGNLDSGIVANAGVTAAITRSNVYGNDPMLNCGLSGAGDIVVEATDVFWGAAQGPGGDPADELCVTVGGAVDASDPAKKEFKVKLRPLK